jgi:transcriptional regulator with XRE-family HTH domain
MSRKLDLSSDSHLLFSLKEGVFLRLKEARNKIRFKQLEIAEIGQVSRATQVSYETDITEPNTGYLRRIQGAGIDIPYVLFGSTTEEILGQPNSNNHIDWPLLQQAFEDVEFFCVRHAPSCPSSYRWKLVSRLYDALQVAKASGTSSSADHMELINDMWDES